MYARRNLGRPSAGFSLLELLVVVTIIGIFAGAAVLSMGIVGGDRQIGREAERLRSLLGLLHEEALLQTRDYGVLFSETGYRFYVYDHQQLAWLEPAGDGFLRPRAMPDAVRLSLLLEGRELALSPSFENIRTERPEPQIMILASGEVTPFEAEIHRELNDEYFALRAELDGTFEVSENGFDDL